VTHAWLRRLRPLLAERRAIVMVELGLLGPIFIIAIVALFVFTYLFMAQMLLDYAVQTVARQIQTGQAQAQSSLAAFTTNVLCPALLVMPCGSNLLVNIKSVSDWYNPSQFTLPVANGQVNTGGLTFCNGNPGQPLEVDVVYMAPLLLGYLFPNSVSYNGSSAFPLYAAAGFVDEWFPITGGVSNPC
jgi:Flp pilus assembly protein TadG